MLGFGWLMLRQSQQALRCGRLEEAHRLLCQPGTHGCKGSGDLLQQLARQYLERAEMHLRHEDAAAAWRDLLLAEQVGGADREAVSLRQLLVRIGIAEVRTLLEAGEPARAAERIAQLRDRAVRQPELDVHEEAVLNWTHALELADRGEFAQALQRVERVRLLSSPVPALLRFQGDLERRRETFGQVAVELHEAVGQGRWRDVLRLADQVLALAPRHLEARKARDRAWKALDMPTMVPTRQPAEAAAIQPATRSWQRFLLWIDGVGGYLVCLEPRVTVGQATAENHVDVPLFADISRLHASLTRDPEGYVLEAARAVQVNGRPVERTLLQSGDRMTLGASCQLQFRQPVPVSASARLDLMSGHRLPLAVEGVLLMADTLVLGSASHVHVAMPDLRQPVVLYRHKDGLGVRHAGNLVIDGQRQGERGLLTPTSTVAGEDFSLSVEPVGLRMVGNRQ